MHNILSKSGVLMLPIFWFLQLLIVFKRCSATGDIEEGGHNTAVGGGEIGTKEVVPEVQNDHQTVEGFDEKPISKNWKNVLNAIEMKNKMRKRLNERYLQNVARLNDYYIPKMIVGLVKKDDSGQFHSPDYLLETMLKFNDKYLKQRLPARHEALQRLKIPSEGCMIGFTLEREDIFEKAHLFEQGVRYTRDQLDKIVKEKSPSSPPNSPQPPSKRILEEGMFSLQKILLLTKNLLDR